MSGKPNRRRIAGETRPGQDQASQDQASQDQSGQDQPSPSNAESTGRAVSAKVSNTKVSRPSVTMPWSRSAKDADSTAADSGGGAVPAGADSSGAVSSGAIDNPAHVASSADAPTPKRRERAGWSAPLKALVALAAVAVVGALVVAGFAVNAASTAAGGPQSGPQSGATQAASDAVAKIFTYDYTNVEKSLSNAEKLMTPAFAKQFESTTPALIALAPQRKIEVEATSRDAAPIPCTQDCEPDKVSVLVFFDMVRALGADSEPTVFANRVRVDMVEVDGTWLVNDIRAL